MVVKLDRERDNMEDEENKDSSEDLTQYLKPWPAKHRTPRIQTWPQKSPSVSSSETSVQADENSDGGPQVSIGSEASGDHVDSEKVIGFADNYSGKLKRKSDESGSWEIEEITQGTKSSSSSTGAPKRYACSFCDKIFWSHEALGGHKSSHKKFKMVIINAKDERRKTDECPQVLQTASATPQPPLLAVADDGTQHTCKICFKTFPSGQALGGHQRRHWTGNIMPHAKTPQILDFDLNELPQEEEEEDSS